MKQDVRLELDPIDVILAKRNLQEGGEAQKFLDSEVLRKCEPYIPMDTGALVNSGTQNTSIGSGQVKWSTPYARRWYYEAAHFQGAPTRGNYWFQRMWNEGGGQDIANGIAQIVGGRTG